MKKFFPSSSAFMIGDTVMTKYDGGCLRMILAKANGLRTGEIPEAYKRVGAAHENATYKELVADPTIKAVQKELPVKRMLTDSVLYSGRMDFKTVREGLEEPIIIEAKGTISKNTRRDVIRKRGFNISYLAQLVSYMFEARTTYGKLKCGYYEENEAGELQEMEGHTFKVRITDSGRIDVDGEPSGHNVAEMLAHQRAAARVIERNEIGPRPDKWNQKWGGPCTSCALARTCELVDSGAIETGDDFIASAKQDGEAAKAVQRVEPVVNKIKVKKPKGESKNGKSKKN